MIKALVSAADVATMLVPEMIAEMVEITLTPIRTEAASMPISCMTGQTHPGFQDK